MSTKKTNRRKGIFLSAISFPVSYILGAIFSIITRLPQSFGIPIYVPVFPCYVTTGFLMITFNVIAIIYAFTPDNVASGNNSMPQNKGNNEFNN